MKQTQSLLKTILTILIAGLGYMSMTAQEPASEETVEAMETEDEFEIPGRASKPEVITLDSLRVMYPDMPAAVVFASLPSSVLPLLTQRDRLDMIDYAQASMKRQIKNLLSGYSSLDTLGNNFITANITDVSSLQIGIFKSPKLAETAVVAYTISPKYAAADSRLYFFNQAMQPVAGKKIIHLPNVEEFIRVPGNDKKRIHELATLIPFPTIRWSVNPAQGILTATLTIDAAMTLENFALLKPYLKPTVTYQWNGKKFELQNN